MSTATAAATAAVLVNPISKLIDSLFTSEEERAAAKLKLFSAEMEPFLKQIDVNLKEAQSNSVFVSGWRPFIGWASGVIFVWNFLCVPFIIWVMTLLGLDVPPFPDLDLSSVMGILGGMLGFGTLRTYEKTKGVASK